MDILFNTIGIIGMLLFISAYFLLQQGTFLAHDMRYLGMNFAGSLAVIVSLLWAWNLPSFLLESAWAVISAYGIIKAKQQVSA